MPAYLIDLDDIEDFSQLAAFVKEHPRITNAWVRRSSSGRGFHVKIDMPVPRELRISRDFNMGVRYALMDCIGRMVTDKMREHAGLPTNRLFYRKNGLEVGNWRKFV